MSQSTSGQDSIINRLDTRNKEEIQQNRIRLSSIIKCLLFIGRYELPLRGHEDFGRFTLDEPDHNDGVFRSILRLLGKAGDPGVTTLFSNVSQNATYLSPRIQNELLSCISRVLLNRVISNIQKSGMYTVMADETSSSTREFISLVVCYVSEDLTVNEAFLGFEQLVGTTGQEVADSILNSLQSYGLNIHHIIAQGYDGASNMASGNKGVHGRIKEIVPTAEYFWCANHRLNLVCTDAAATVPIAQLISCVKEIISYFADSVKRADVFKRFVSGLVSESNRSKLTNLCPTRWVERHEALLAFKELLPAVFAALQFLAETENDHTPAALLQNVSSFNSMFSLIVASDIAGDLKSISKYLQKQTVDLLSAYDEIKNTKKSLELRIESDADFEKLYGQCKKLAEDLGVTEEVPMFMARRLGDTLVPPYYQENVYRVYVQKLIEELNYRFNDFHKMAFTIQALLPRFIFSLDDKLLYIWCL